MSEAAAAQAGTEQGATGQPTGQQTQAWFDSLDPDTRAWSESKGWADPDPVKVLPKILQSGRNAEQLISKIKGDPNRIVVLPKDPNNVEEMSAYREKMGIPKDITEYGFDMEKPEGQKFAELAHKVGMTKEAANEFMTMAQTLVAEKEAAKAQEYQQQSAQEMADWKREMGATAEQKIQVAKQAFKAFPQIAERSAEIEAAMGTKAYMAFLADLGSKIGEAGSAGANQSSSNMGMTPQMAKQKIQEIYLDSNKRSALMDDTHPGHAGAKAELLRLNQYISG